MQQNRIHRRVVAAVLTGATVASIGIGIGPVAAQTSPPLVGGRAPRVLPCSYDSDRQLCIEVQEGEWLWSVARTYQADRCLPVDARSVGRRAKDMHRRNRGRIGRNPNRVRAGMELSVTNYTTVTRGSAQFVSDPNNRCPGAP